MPDLSRRFLILAAATGFAGQAAAQGSPFGSPFGGPTPDPVWGDPAARRRPAREAPQEAPGPTPRVAGEIDYDAAYAAVGEEPFPVQAFRWRRMNPAFLRQVVAYPGNEEPGTVIIDPRAHHLTLVYGAGTAMRYGVGVGRQGFGWSGVAQIRSKQAWPDWYPPKEMLDRQRDLARQMSQLQSGIGMAGGPRNPLGARAMYLWQGNKDTLYRIHGTVEPETIGHSVSSGCIRMINQDAIDLYGRVPIGAKVIVVG